MLEKPSASLEEIRNHPECHAVVKTLLKSQIKLLVEQLSFYAGEEAILLSASITDGTLSHIGSKSGEIFLNTHGQVKSEFLGFCLDRHKTSKEQESEREQSKQTGSKSAVETSTAAPNQHVLFENWTHDGNLESVSETFQDTYMQFLQSDSDPVRIESLLQCDDRSFDYSSTASGSEHEAEKTDFQEDVNTAVNNVIDFLEGIDSISKPSDVTTSEKPDADETSSEDFVIVKVEPDGDVSVDDIQDVSVDPICVDSTAPEADLEPDFNMQGPVDDTEDVQTVSSDPNNGTRQASVPEVYIDAPEDDTIDDIDVSLYPVCDISPTSAPVAKDQQQSISASSERQELLATKAAAIKKRRKTGAFSSIETRYRAIMAVEEGNKMQKDVAQEFNIYKTTLCKWVQNAEAIKYEYWKNDRDPKRIRISYPKSSLEANGESEPDIGRVSVPVTKGRRKSRASAPAAGDRQKTFRKRKMLPRETRSRKKQKRAVTYHSIEDRYRAILALEEGTRMQKDIAEEFNVPQNTLCTWKKCAEKIKNEYLKNNHAPGRKRTSRSKYQDIEKALLDWVRAAKCHEDRKSSKVLMEKAQEVAADLGYTEDQFSCTRFWVTNFRTHFGFLHKKNS